MQFSFSLSLAPSPILLCRFMYFKRRMELLILCCLEIFLNNKHNIYTGIKSYVEDEGKHWANRKGFLSTTNLTGISKSFGGFKWNFFKKKLKNCLREAIHVKLLMQRELNLNSSSQAAEQTN